MCKFFWGRFKIQSKSCCYPGSFADFRVSKYQIWPKQKIQICTNGVELIAKWTKDKVSVPMLKCGSILSNYAKFCFQTVWNCCVVTNTPWGQCLFTLYTYVKLLDVLDWPVIGLLMLRFFCYLVGQSSIHLDKILNGMKKFMDVTDGSCYCLMFCLIMLAC